MAAWLAFAAYLSSNPRGAILETNCYAPHFGNRRLRAWRLEEERTGTSAAEASGCAASTQARRLLQYCLKLVRRDPMEVRRHPNTDCVRSSSTLQSPASSLSCSTTCPICGREVTWRGLDLLPGLERYLFFTLVVSLAVRFRQYRTILSFCLKFPKQWPRLFEVASRYKGVFLAWTTLVPVGVMLLVLLAHSVSYHFIWHEAHVTAYGLAENWALAVPVALLGRADAVPGRRLAVRCGQVRYRQGRARLEPRRGRAAAAHRLDDPRRHDVPREPQPARRQEGRDRPRGLQCGADPSDAAVGVSDRGPRGVWVLAVAGVRRDQRRAFDRRILDRAPWRFVAVRALSSIGFGPPPRWTKPAAAPG